MQESGKRPRFAIDDDEPHRFSVSPPIVPQTRKQSAIGPVSELPTASSSFKGSNKAEMMMMSIENDELKLLNEQLKNQLATLRDSSERARAKLLHQMTFIESENDQLKSALEEKTEMYYEEKKKWQTRCRSLEADQAKLQRELEELQSTKSAAHSVLVPAPAASRNGVNIMHGNSPWKVRLEELEDSVLSKSTQLLASNNKIADLEEVNKNNEQELLILRAAVRSSQSQQEDAKEARELRRKYADLEKECRAKTRELSNVDGKLKNQSLLSEEVAGLTSKLANAVQQMDRLKTIQGKYQQYLQEKQNWNKIFGDAMKESMFYHVYYLYKLLRINFTFLMDSLINQLID